MTKTLLGYKIFDTLQDFYDWQGYNGNPNIGTVNKIMGYSTDNPIDSIRFTIPIPHSTATSITYDDLGMPTSITGSDLRALSPVTSDCPIECVPTGLITKASAIAEGWDLEPIDE